MASMHPSGFRRVKIVAEAVIETDLPIDENGRFVLPDGKRLYPYLTHFLEDDEGIVDWLDSSELFERGISRIAENTSLDVIGGKELPTILSRQEAKTIYANAVSVYQNSHDGQDAVLKWAEAYHFPHAYCGGCECEVPILVEETERCCLVCGSAV